MFYKERCEEVIMSTTTDRIIRLLQFTSFTVVLLSFWIYPIASATPQDDPDNVTAAILHDSVPTQFQDAKTGNPSGFAVDIMNKIAERAGLQVTYTFANTWTDMIGKVKSGEADLIPSIAISDERQQVLLFTELLDSSPVSIIVRSQDYTTNGLRKGLKVGTIKGSIAYDETKKVPDVDIYIFDSFTDAFFDLLAGKIDAFTGAATTFIKMAREAGLEDKIKIVGEPLIEVKRAIAVRKDNTALHARLNKAIEGFVGSTDYQRIYAKWYGKPAPYWTTQKIVLAMSLAILVSVFGMAFWRYRSILRLNRTLLESINERKKAEEALKNSEERLKQIVERSPLPMAVTDLRDNFILLNNKFQEVFGYTLEDLQSVEDWWPRAYPDEEYRKTVMAKWNTAVAEAIKTGKEIAPQEAIVTCKNGVRRTIEAMLAPIGDTHVVILHDITERKKMAEEIIKIQKLESLGVLAGGIAHDFNNILTAIMGNIEIATAYTNPGDTIRDLLINTEKASLRARDLTQQLLTFSKGGMPVKKTVSLDILIKETSSFTLKGAKVRCEFDIQEDLWAVDADEGQIGQVIQNLVINGDQSMPEGGILKIRARNLLVTENLLLPLKQGKYVQITIQDHGVGIPANYLQKIFDPYFTTKQKGSGLGLAVTYSIIANHGGHIAVSSELGVGTTFDVYLPASEMILEKKPEKELPLTGRGKILLMDDDEMVISVAGAMLKSFGYEVASAKDGQETIDLYKKALEESQPYSLVIMDLTIPGGMGGKETVTKLKLIDPHLKAIVSSGYSNDPVLAEYRQYGFLGIIPKPFKMSQLSEEVSRVLKLAS